MGFPKSSFEGVFDKFKEDKGITLDTELSNDDLKEIIRLYKNEYLKLAGDNFPSDPRVQLLEAVKAVFRSWNTERAITYRIFLLIGEQQLMFNKWFMEIETKILVLVFVLQGIRQQGTKSCLANI